MNNPICNTCGLQKDQSEFYAQKSNKSGFSLKCKECDNARRRKGNRNKKSLAIEILSIQRRSSIKRNHPAPNYSKDEFMNWFLNHSKLNYLFNKWKESGFVKEHKPSVDRISNFKGYSFDNIRLVSWKQNMNQYNEDKKNGLNNNECKPVLQLDSNLVIINTFHSARQAARETGFYQASISRACNGTGNLNGYVWQYKK